MFVPHVVSLLLLIVACNSLPTSFTAPSLAGIDGMAEKDDPKNSPNVIPNQKLIILVFDGVRHDYVNDPKLTGFKRLAQQGVKAKWNTPIYPANSYPNWYAISTGLFGESHGFVQNRMYDKEHKSFFLMNPENTSAPYWWNGAEPIWISAEKQGIKTVMFNWDGCQVEIKGRRPSICTENRNTHSPDGKDIWPNVKEDTIKALNKILDKFESNQNYRLGMAYYQSVDDNGHNFGPDSNETKKAMMKASEVVEALLEEIDKRKLTNTVNVYVLSDHGMSKPTQKIRLDEIIDMNDVKYMMDKGSLTMILPQNDQALARMNQRLIKANRTGLHFYLKKDIPEILHFKNHSRILSLVIRADAGYLIEAPPIPGKTFPNYPLSYPGHHGYYADEFDEMNGIMMAKGPSFKPGLKLDQVRQVDHYQVFCHILNINPKANNGTWSHVKDAIIN